MQRVEKIGKEKRAVWQAFYRGKNLRGLQPVFKLSVNTLSQAFGKHKATPRTEEKIDTVIAQLTGKR